MDAKPILSRQVQPFGSLLALLMLLSICMPSSAETGIVFSAQYYTWKHGKVQPKQKFHHLYLTRSDGTHPHLLTSGAFDDMYPKWSHDHKQIAFLRRYSSGASYLCTLSMPSHHISRLYTLGAQEFIEFSWSPSRNLIALLSREYYSGSDSAVHSFILLEGSRIKIKSKDVDDFSWSPDNRHIYLSHGDAGCEVLNIATHQSRLISILEKPIWLDNHSLLGVITEQPDAPSAENHFHVLDVNTGRLRKYELVVHHTDGDRDPLEPGVDLTWHRSPTNKNAFVLEVTYRMSDGDHTWSFTTTLGSSQGQAISIGGYDDGVAFGGYSPGGKEFACYSAEWVGGYKRTGAQLGPLEIRNIAGKRIKFVTSKMVQVIGASWY